MKKTSKINFGIFYSAVEAAETYNARMGFKRFYPINSRTGNISTFGIYDYQTKKYVLSTPTCDLNEVFNEIKKLVENAATESN